MLGVVDVAVAKKKKKDKTHNPAMQRAMTHHQRGVMAHVQGDPDGAVQAFQAAIDAKPDFAYAYYRMGFVMEEVRKSKRKAQRMDNAAALTAFQHAVALDPADEMARLALGHALHDRQQYSQAAAAFEDITVTLNPRSAHAYWALGKVRASTRDEFESDPEDPSDPSHMYELASSLLPNEFQPDGTRVKRVEPMTPERQEREEQEAKERRQRVLQEWKDGTRPMRVAGDDEAHLSASVPPDGRRVKNEL